MNNFHAGSSSGLGRRILLGLLLCLADARATTFTYTVTNAADSGAGSLRAALAAINVNAFFDDFTVAFDLPPPYRIAVTGALPMVRGAASRPVLVDGTTQPGFAGTPLIQLDGYLVPAGNGLALGGNGSILQALCISNFTNGQGVRVMGSSNRLVGCWIMSNAVGVALEPAVSNAFIGGVASSNRNVISANAGIGIDLGSALRAVVQGNFIGVDPSGLNDLGNGDDGIAGWGADVLIGGTNAGARNVIAGNGDDGINLHDTTNVTIQGNFVGVGASGRQAVTNDGAGIRCERSDAVIGGPGATARNVVSGNKLAGIWLDNAGSSKGAEVAGNFVGTDVTGTNALPNAGSGIYAVGRSNVIGGATAAHGNVIAGNAGYGIWLDQPSNAYTTVEHNLIGLGTNGVPLSNGTPGHAGLAVVSHQNLIAFNVISGQAGTGLAIGGGDNNLVAGNLIGVDATGTAARPNGRGGVVLANGACSNLIGTVAFRNLISANQMIDGVGGVTVRDRTSVSNVVGYNYIGTDLNGRLPLGNDGAAIAVENAVGTQIIGNLVADGDLGIHIFGTNVSDAVVDGNRIGLDVTGTNALPLAGDGIWIENGSGHRVGIGARNVVAGNGGHGVLVQGPVSNLVVAGNYVGVATNGTLRRGNQLSGIQVLGAIGAGLLFSNNVVSGNTGAGLLFMASQLTNCVVAGNVIGLSAAGNTVVSNTDAGVAVLQASNVRVGGPTAAERNIIAGNGGDQINFEQADSNGASVVAGNYIGLSVSGGALPTSAGTCGIRALGTPRLQVGGPTIAWRNVIGGHLFGVLNEAGDDCWIANNYIGTDPAGVLARPNGFGITLSGACRSNLVENNIVAGNDQQGLTLTSGPRWGIVRANRIGLGSLSGLPNGGVGLVLSDAADCLVGGESAADGNRIAFNGGVGILVTQTGPGLGSRNRLLANLVYSNGLGGIDLGGDGVTANDSAPDADSGPNGLQNYPVLAFASAGGTNICGTFSGAPGPVRLEFFALTPALGSVFLGAVAHYSPPSGVAPFSFSFASNAPAGSTIVATATTDDGTSEFSAGLALSNGSDTDADLMPDWWELAHGLYAAVSNAPGSDVDGDGVSDLGEWIADTLPADTNSFPRIVAFTNAAGRIALVPSSGLRVYNLESAAAPGGAAWSLVLTNVPGTGALLALQDASGYTQRVYRVGVHLP